jgi:SAM-dependent methyltransferase
MLDLVTSEERMAERRYYDDFYSSARSERGETKEIAALARTWTHPEAPLEMRTAWERLGDLRRKRVLLLGNGESDAELFMLTQEPELLIFSDLAIEPMRAVRDAYRLDSEPITFAAIDALDLPFVDASVDVVYGFAFVHHLPDLDRFLAEVARVLRPGGRAVFMDNAYSPVWQWAKRTWLKRLMALSHRRDPRSPEDVRDPSTAGYRLPSLEAGIRAVGGQPWFVRQSFFYYFWHRASVSLFRDELRVLPRARIAAAMARLDAWLSRFRFMRENTIRLIWGFDRPPGAGQQPGVTVGAPPSSRPGVNPRC